MKEALLIQRCKEGDRAAQRWLFDAYYKYVYTVCHRYVNHHQDAEDVVSEVFHRIFKNMEKLSDTRDQGLKRWIQTIAINESLRFIKRRKPIAYTTDENLMTESVYSGYGSNAEPSMNSIKQAVNSMPMGYRTIFLLNVVEGLSHSEIAVHLGISRNTSKSQLLKAKKYLQNKLGSNAGKLGR